MIRLYFHRGVGRNVFPLNCGVGLLGLALLAGGCGITLEDGYKPRALGATPETRKAYYASPYTDQAEAGNKDAAPAVRAGPR